MICFNNEIQDFKNLHDVFIFSEKIKSNIHEMQIYVMKNADIFITNMFGPKNVASVLGIPTLVCDSFPYSSIIPYNRTDITIPKIVEKNKKKLSFKEVIDSGYFHNLKIEKNLTLIENSSEDIMDGLDQILNRSLNKDCQIMKN